MGERWRDVPGYSDIYQVSDQGRVRSFWRAAPHIMRATPDHGYPRVALSNGKTKRLEYVHRLVCLAFHGPAPSGCEVAHNDGDSLNCSADNLRWATRQENIHDQIMHGTKGRGERMSCAKLTDEKVRALRNDPRSSRVACLDYGINHRTYLSARSGRTWAHVRG